MSEAKKVMANLPAWVEIPATDLARAKKFYQAILGVEMIDVDIGNELKMAMFPVDEQGVGGAICEHSEFYHPGSEGPLVYLNAGSNLQQVLDRIIPNGGKVLQGKTEITEEYGFMAIFEDTEGNRMALHSMG